MKNLITNISEKKSIKFSYVQMIHVHVLTLNFPLEYAKRPGKIIVEYTAATSTFAV